VVMLHICTSLSHYVVWYFYEYVKKVIRLSQLKNGNFILYVDELSTLLSQLSNRAMGAKRRGCNLFVDFQKEVGSVGWTLKN